MAQRIHTIIDFPEETNQKEHTKIYGEQSIEDTLAVLSHQLQNYKSNGCYLDKNKEHIAKLLLDYLDYKQLRSNYSDDDISEMKNLVAESPLQFDFFSDFFQTPFPIPKNPKFTFIDLFAGIGGIRLPFTELGYQCVFSSEWDKKAKESYFANFGEIPFGDITRESIKQHIPKEFDILLAGFPCQAFSIMGKMKGFEDTRGTLFFDVATILKRHQPKAFLLENVKQLVTHKNGETFKKILCILTELGYHFKWKVLNALDFGLPQKRERVIIVGFLDKSANESFSLDFEKQQYNLQDILEKDEDVDPKLFASDDIFKKRLKRTKGKEIFYPSVWHENKSKNISILDHACALRTGASYNYLLINGIRRPSSRELLRFQGFPDNYKIAVSHSEIRRQTGNSVAVPMIRAIAQRINEVLTKTR